MVEWQVDYVRAELTDQNKPLPRIPPVRGTLGLDWSHNSFRRTTGIDFGEPANACI